MDELERFAAIKEKREELSNRKIRVEERLKSEKKQLEELIEEIKGKGFDPKKLASIKQEKQEELDKLLTELEKEIQETSEKLDSIEV